MDLKELIICFGSEGYSLSGQSTLGVGVQTRGIMIQIKDRLTDEFPRFDSDGIEALAF